MEKRNFVTPLRTVEASTAGDELIDAAAALFNGKNEKNASAEGKTPSEFEKRACREDEKSDSLC